MEAGGPGPLVNYIPEVTMATASKRKTPRDAKNHKNEETVVCKACRPKSLGRPLRIMCREVDACGELVTESICWGRKGPLSGHRKSHTPSTDQQCGYKRFAKSDEVQDNTPASI